MKEEPNSPPINRELEARVVALVLGEASDFERDELQRQIEERPELAAFKQEIRSVHGLLREVASGESVAVDDDWKLSPERRSALLAVISGEASAQPMKQLAVKSADHHRRQNKSLLWKIAKVAAVFVVVGFFGVVLMLQRSSLILARRMSTSDMASYESAAQTPADNTSAPGVHIYMADAAMSMAADKQLFDVEQETDDSDYDYQESTKSSFEDLRESLDAEVNLPSPYYLMDDVQYFPVTPQSGLPQEAMTSGEARASQTPNRAPAPGVGGPGPGLLPSTSAGAAVLPLNVQRSDTEISMGSFFQRDSFGIHSGLDDKLADTAGDSGSGMAMMGMRDQPMMEGESKASPDLAVPSIRSQNSGPSQLDRKADALYEGLPEREGRISLGGVIHDDAGVTAAAPAAKEAAQLFGRGEDLRLLGESPVSGEGMGVDDNGNGAVDSRDGYVGGGGYGGYRGEGDSEALPPPQKPAQTAPREFGDQQATAEQQDGEPSQPLIAGIAGRRQSEQAEDRYERDWFDARIASDPTPSSSDEKKQRRFGVVAPNEPGVTERSAVTRSDEETMLGKNPKVVEGQPSVGEFSVPMTGTSIGLPFGEVQLGQKSQGQRSAHEALPHTPLGGPAGLSRHTVAPQRYGRGFEANGERAKSKHEDESLELRQQANPVAINETTRQYGFAAPLSQDLYKSMGRAPQSARIAGDTITSDISGLHFIDETKKSAAPAGLNEKSAEEEAFSTFSLHVGDVSFKLARAALASGTWPEAAKIRIEEFVNAFDYGDPMPSQSEKVACRVEQAVHPFLQQRNLLRVSMRTAAAGRSSNTPLRLTLLLDNSGSMERIDRRQTVRRAFALLAQQLKPIDQVTLISFARQPRLLADKVSGSQTQQLVQLIERLPSEGGTNIEAALQLAFEKAREQHTDAAQNRIVLLTDGAVNLGNADPESLSQMIAKMRAAGIAFDAAGISAEGLNDEVLEALTRKGDGRYYLLDSLESAEDGFARQLAGALRPSVMNVKVQIEFNPQRVGRYKLLGFEKHRLKKEDFRNDKVDAAEMSAAEAGVAMYQFEAKPDGEGDVGSVSVRFLDVSTGQMIENCWPIPYEPDAPRLDQAAPSLRVATSAALLAANLRGDPLGETVDLKTLSNLVAGLPAQDRNADRVQQLQQMIGQARQVSGE